MPGTVAVARLDVEADPKAIRSETVRAVRSIRAQPSLLRELQPDRLSHGTPCLLVRIMRDLEQSLVAISHSLAEGVDHATGGPST